MFFKCTPRSDRQKEPPGSDAWGQQAQNTRSTMNMPLPRDKTVRHMQTLRSSGCPHPLLGCETRARTEGCDPCWNATQHQLVLRCRALNPTSALHVRILRGLLLFFLKKKTWIALRCPGCAPNVLQKCPQYRGGENWIQNDRDRFAVAMLMHKRSQSKMALFTLIALCSHFWSSSMFALVDSSFVEPALSVTTME